MNYSGAERLLVLLTWHLNMTQNIHDLRLKIKWMNRKTACRRAFSTTKCTASCWVQAVWLWLSHCWTVLSSAHTSPGRPFVIFDSLIELMKSVRPQPLKWAVTKASLVIKTFNLLTLLTKKREIWKWVGESVIFPFDQKPNGDWNHSSWTFSPNLPSVTGSNKQMLIPLD